MNRWSALLLSLCVWGAALEASALTINTTDDALVESFFPDLVQGADTTLTASNLSSIMPPDISRIYLKFTMPAFTPGTSISTASLSGFLEQSFDFGGLIYGLSVASLDTWDESTITWNNQPGIGAATGATFDPTGIADGTPVSIPGLAAAADSAYQGDGVLSLVMFISDESQLVCTVDCPFVIFTSDEGGNGFALDVTIVPEPGSAPLLAFGLVCVAVIRRRTVGNRR